MFRNLPKAQRRLFLLSLVALALAIGFVVVAVVFATGRPAVDEGEYEPFVIGDASALGQHIATERPLFFADPTGGTRGFALAIVDGEIQALHVIPPGGSSQCPVDWDPGDERFEDCRETVYRPEGLNRFPTTVNDDGDVVVDLRETLPPIG